jgi:MoaA/NifB/PqqE/SkfB family radical SAM enzyme
MLTQNCNLRCKHCYVSAGPGKEDTTVSLKNFKKMLKNLPNERIDLTLSGGELFTVEERLFEYLSELQDLRQQKGRKNIDLCVQTNGFWLKRKDAAKILEGLKHLDVDELEVTSKDYYHREQGLNITKREIELAQEVFEFVGYKGTPKNYVAPFGRAKNLKLLKKQGATQHCRDVVTDRSADLVIRNNGKVSPCCYSMFEYPGNIFENPLTEIIQNAMRDEKLTALNQNGLLGVIQLEGRDIGEFSQLREKYGTCVACQKLYESKYGPEAKK